MLDNQPQESRRLLSMDDAAERSSENEWKRENTSELNMQEDEESKYPPFKTVIVSMICIYAAMFLAALVSHFSRYHKTQELTSRRIEQL